MFPLAETAYLAQLLHPAEQVRLKRFVQAEAALHFLAGRLLLRRALQEYQLAPPNAAVSEGAEKPFLINFPSIDFNISHSGGLVVCAVSTGGRIGVDTERVKTLDMSAFQDYFSEKERQWMQKTASPEQAFFRLWTRKEALAKADGRGLSLPFDTFETLESTVWVEDKCWFLYDLILANSHATALSYKSGAPFRPYPPEPPKPNCSTFAPGIPSSPSKSPTAMPTDAPSNICTPTIAATGFVAQGGWARCGKTLPGYCQTSLRPVPPQRWGGADR